MQISTRRSTLLVTPTSTLMLPGRHLAQEMEPRLRIDGSISRVQQVYSESWALRLTGWIPRCYGERREDFGRTDCGRFSPCVGVRHFLTVPCPFLHRTKRRGYGLCGAGASFRLNARISRSAV